MSDDEGNYSELETGSENSEGEQDYGEDAGSDIDEHTLENNYNDLLNEKINLVINFNKGIGSINEYIFNIIKINRALDEAQHTSD